MVVTDILRVLYQPHKAFKKIVEDPKYLGALIVLIIFVAAETAFYYSYYQKNYWEQTAPDFYKKNIAAWTENATMWQTGPNGTITINNVDFVNSTNQVYGNGSIQFNSSNAKSISMALTGIDQVDCGPNGYQNLSMRIKLVQPQTNPSRVTLTLYSLTDANNFQYDLTPTFSNYTTNTWNNITVPVGSGNWQSTGSPNWSNITQLMLSFEFPSSTSITLRITALFFRGTYETPIATLGIGFPINILQAVFTQFLFAWLILTALLYIIIKLLKGNLTWKPIFVAMGIALIVMTIQTLLNIAATTTLPQLYFPIESSIAANVSIEAQAIDNVILAQMATFSYISSIIQLATYIWIGALCTFIVRAIMPDYTWTKTIAISVATVFLTIIILGFLGFSL